MREVKLFIGGEFRSSSDNKTVTSIDPSSNAPVAMVHIPSTSDINEAVEAAHKAFYNPEWSQMSRQKRSELLLAISDKIKERKNEFIQEEIKDSGSTFRKASADVHNTASFFKVMSKVASEFSLESEDAGASRAGFSKNKRSYSPIGVCAQIIPWNFPLVMAAWKIGPVLATGCTTVIKSAIETPVTAGLLAEVLKEVGVPAGVVNIITGGAIEGETLIKHPKISKIAFTGSTAVGKIILEQASKTVKKTTLELGGKSPNIILSDANLDIAVDGALYAFLYHQGQACDSGTRLLVQEDIYDAFLAKFLSRIEQIKISTTDDKNAGFGPVISEKQFKTIMNYIQISKNEGAKLLFGGSRIEGEAFKNGYFISPTVFEITPKNTIWKEEIFGPVVGITKFKTQEEAIALANDSIYGLAAAVWTSNEEKGQEIANKLEAGTVWINEYHLLNPGMPFGGLKQSGIGREMGEEGIHAYLEVKHIWQSDCNERSQKVWFDALF